MCEKKFPHLGMIQVEIRSLEIDVNDVSSEKSPNIFAKLIRGDFHLNGSHFIGKMQGNFTHVNLLFVWALMFLLSSWLNQF